MLRHNLIARHLTDHRITSTLQMVKQSHYFIEKLQMEIISNEGMHQFEGDLYVGSQPASIQPINGRIEWRIRSTLQFGNCQY